MTDVNLRPFAPQDLEWLVTRHADLYAEEAGFDASFGDVVRAVITAFVARADPQERGFVACAEGQRIGHILSTRLDAITGQVRLFLVEPEWRGSGIAPRLLQAAEDFARDQGCSAMKLWTHESHRAACALYARSGWQAGARRAVANYGQALVEVVWTKPL